MPPDRTQRASPTPLTLPLSSHPGSTSIERGKACTTCKRRKVKCDGAQPICGSCTRTAQIHKHDLSTITCLYKESNSAPAPRGSGGGAKVVQLEAKIVELERIVARLSSVTDSSYPGEASTSQLPSLDSSGHSSPSSGFGHPYDLPPIHGPSTLDPLYPGGSIHEYPQFSSTSYAHPPPPRPPSPNSDLLNIFFPGWPATLPSAALTLKMINTFFTKPHAATNLLDRGKFMAALSLPPTSDGFPEIALLHAILGLVAQLFGEEESDRYWERSELGKGKSQAEYHHTLSKAAIDEVIARTRVQSPILFQVTQALSILCFISYTSGRFLEVWMLSALVTRVASPLGLNHLRPQGGELNHGPRKAILWDSPKDEAELYERSTAFWIGVLCDRFACAATGWHSSIDEADITSLLPALPGSPLIYKAEDLMASPLSIHNPTFFMAHPPELVGEFQLYIKATLLLGRVVAFRHRTPEPIGAGIEMAPLKFDYRLSPGFRKIEDDINSFYASIPPRFKVDVSGYHSNPTPDGQVYLVNLIPQAAIIILHEPFVTMRHEDPSFAKCIASARAIYAVINSLWTASFEIALLSPFINSTWAIAGRTLVRELAIKKARGETQGIDELKTDINLIMAAMRAWKSVLGDNTASTLRELMDYPESCLPSFDQDVLHRARPADASSDFMSVHLSRPAQLAAAMRDTSSPSSTGSSMPATSPGLTRYDESLGLGLFQLPA